MSDLFNLSNLGVNDDNSSLSTGDLRRKFNFGDQVSELAIAQDPFFRFVSMVSKNPTDDPSFKFTERRPSYHKRYAYIMGFVSNGSDEFGDAELDRSDAAAAVTAVGQTVKLYMATDYKSEGNIQNIYSQTNSKIDVGSTGTRPTFFIQDQLVKIPVTSTAGGAGAVKGYHVMKIDTVTGNLTKDSKECVAIEGKIVKFDSAGNELVTFHTNNFSPGNAAGDEIVVDQSISSELEHKRSYVIGSAHAEGSGYPETWKDQPFSTGFGYTQIWKTTCAMTNTARATSLKYDSSEWARVWKEKLIEHKYDIEQSLLFGSQATQDGIQYTQGAVDYCLTQGNVFEWTTSKSQDDFLNDMSNFLDPRYNNGNATVFFVSTDVYNWLHKLGGYALSNLQLGNDTGNNINNYYADLGVSGKKNVLGLGVSTISTVYGDMNVVRNIHLDQTDVKILACNMKYAKYRPLVGNGVDRDTSIYVGVQTLENSGVDRRVDLILTEAGMEFSMPEAHAVWKQG